MKHSLTTSLFGASICALACLVQGSAAANGSDANALANQAQLHPWEANQTGWVPWGVPVGEVYPAAPGGFIGPNGYHQSGYDEVAPTAPAYDYGHPAVYAYPGLPYGYSAPAYGHPARAYEYRAPAYGGPTPAYGYRAPAYGYRAPAYGYPAPAYGSPEPAYGDSAPASAGHPEYEYPAPDSGYSAPANGSPEYGYSEPGAGESEPGYGSPAPGEY